MGRLPAASRPHPDRRGGSRLRRGREWLDALTGEVVAALEAAPAPSRRREPAPTRDEAEELARSAPDGAREAFVRGGDLHVRDLATGAVRALTRDGGEAVLNGKLDWVYQEEIYGRGRFRAFWWSPDGRRLAFLRIDSREVRTFVLTDDRPDHPRSEVTRYPLPGTPNPVATLHVHDVETGETRDLPTGTLADREPLIVAVDWHPGEAHRLIFQVQDRLQKELELVEWDAVTGTARVLVRESSPHWVNVLGPPHWLADGGFLWWSERSGYRHLYRAGPGGGDLRPLTSGSWEATDLVDVDEEAGWVYFHARREDAVGRRGYRVRLEGGEPECLTPGRGTHRMRLCADRRRVVDEVTHLEEAGRVVLRDLEGGEIRELARAERTDRVAYRAPRLETIAARDGFPIDVTLRLPPGPVPPGGHPMMLLTYSGPNAPSVHDAFPRGAWHQFLAQEGVAVLQANNRSASGRGHRHVASGGGRFGPGELADLEDAVDWAISGGGIDASRVGLSGWSFGGFITVYALCRSERFRLGIAGAGVYDWRLYDSIYTERYLGSAVENAEGYRASSPVEFAADLKGKLLLVHGTTDDNVHFQCALRLCHALQKAGRSFEFMPYPRSRHGLRDPDLRRHLRRLEWDLIRRELLGR
ncbi:MAG: S9 family peptidase [Planctomycetota bacterium]